MKRYSRSYYVALAEKQFEESEIQSISDMDKEKFHSVMTWVKQWMRHSKKNFLKMSSYEIKHIVEEMLGFYITEVQFKQIMAIRGFFPINPSQENWYFKICEYPFFYIYMEYGYGHKLKGWPDRNEQNKTPTEFEEIIDMMEVFNMDAEKIIGLCKAIDKDADGETE